MSVNPGLFSSTTCEWATPEGFFRDLEAEFGPFDLDPCATEVNRKADRHHDGNGWSGLAHLWTGRVFMNPPYGRGIGKWVAKAYESAQAGALVVCLLPSRTDTTWWHQYVMKASEIRFIKGRLKFGDAKNSAPFPSAVVVFATPTGGAR